MFHKPSVRAGALLAVSLTFGCASAQAERYARLSGELRPPEPSPPRGNAREPDFLKGEAVLDRQRLITAVLARNPSVQAARHAFRAALSRYPSQSALEDPMLAYSFAPLSIASDEVPYGQTVTLEQRLPWPGKLALRGEVALAEAEAARDDYEALRLRLALMASLLFDEYYAVARSLELNAEHRALMEEIEASARAQYRAGRAPQAEPLSAEVELAHIVHEQVMLQARRAVVVAQLNELLRRRPELPLPPPPAELAVEPIDLGHSEALQREALAARPELRSERARLRARQSAVDLARREAYPDFGVMASYSSMWMQTEHQFMLGLSLNLPLQLDARDAAIGAARAELARTRAELLGARDSVRSEVEQARLRLLEGQHVLEVYRERLLPTAQARIEAARIGYETGQSSFEALIEAERSLRTLQLQYQDALALLGRRRAELQRALGQLPGELERPEAGGAP